MKKLLLALVFVLALAVTAFAWTYQTGQMTVSATVQPVATFYVGNLDFGIYDANNPNPTPATGLITVDLPMGMPFGVAINSGDYGPPGFGPRTMLGQMFGNPLIYEIFHDNSGMFGPAGTPWGSDDMMGQFGPMGPLSGVVDPYNFQMAYANATGPGFPVQMMPYAEIGPNQFVPDDAYDDVIDVVLVY